jgi:hypothetical protein
MRRATILSFAIIGFAVGLAFPAAADPSQIYGKWVEQGSNGAELITVFTATTAFTYGLDPSGKRVGEATRFSVTYKDVGPSTIQANFQKGSSIVLHIEDKNTIEMEIPGDGTRTLTRDGF